MNQVAVEEVKPYLIGIKEGGPAWNFTLAGITFHVYTSSYDDSGREVQRSGSIVKLTKKRLVDIREALSTKIVRWVRRGDKVLRAQVYDTRQTGFVPEPDDDPLENWLYVQPAPQEARPISGSLLEQITREVESARAAEAKAVADPNDARIREAHARAKKLGTDAEGNPR